MLYTNSTKFKSSKVFRNGQTSVMTFLKIVKLVINSFKKVLQSVAPFENS